MRFSHRPCVLPAPPSATPAATPGHPSPAETVDRSRMRRVWNATAPHGRPPPPGGGMAVAESAAGHRALPSRSCTVKSWHGLSPAGVLPPAIITHMFVIEYIFLLWRAASEKAGIGVRAGLPWRTTRTLSKHPGPGSPARQARRNGRPRRDGACKRQRAPACLNVNECGPVHSRFGSILRFGSSATRIVLRGQKPGFSRGCERHLS